MKGQLLLVFAIFLCLLTCGCIHTQERSGPSSPVLSPVVVNPSIPSSVDQSLLPPPLPPSQISYQNGLLLLNQGKYHDAIDELNTSIELDDTNSDAYLVRGKAYYAIADGLYYESNGEEEYKSAINDFDQSLTNSSDDAQVLTLRGWSNLQLANLYRDKHFLYGKYAFPYAESAIADFSQALAINPDEVNALDGRALAYSLTGSGTREEEHGYNETKINLAHADARKAMRIDPYNPWNFYTTGTIRRDADREAPEIYYQDFNEAILLDPTEPLFYVGRAHAVMAIAAYEPGEQDDPERFAEPDDDTGDKDALYDSIIDDYETAIDLKPDYAMAYMEEGTLLNSWEETGDDLDISYTGLDTMKTAVDINPGVSQFHVNLARGWLNSVVPLSRQGFEKILARIDTAINLDPDNMDAHFYRWYVLNYLNRYHDAQDEVKIYKMMAKTNEEKQLATEMEDVESAPGNVHEFLKRYDELIRHRV